MLTCPRCRRSPAQCEPLAWYDGLASLFRLRPFRCFYCWKRFYRPRWAR